MHTPDTYNLCAWSGPSSCKFRHLIALMRRILNLSFCIVHFSLGVKTEFGNDDLTDAPGEVRTSHDRGKLLMSFVFS